MGSVWLAERCDGRFEGRAAVKLLNIAVMGRAGEERFRREGNILARLTHPNIARLIDAGVSPTGQPYLVLEHVDGQTIDRYCDEHALGVEARLRLFLDVLEAVAHAHANLIVHRDIKPANVLVSVDGQVKLLDFGIAKLLEDDEAPSDGTRSADTAPLTRDGWAATPQYAAPEQVAGGVVTTATDVYALGVLLYVLLTGTHPAGAAAHSPATLMHAIVEVEPRRLSDAVGQPESPEALASHAARCGTTPARLRRMLRGDLDTIVAKALKKNAAERYASVTALADDIRRFLRHEPISARPRHAALSSRDVRQAARARRRRLGGRRRAARGADGVPHGAARDRARPRAARGGEGRKASEVLTGLLTAADPYDVADREADPTIRGRARCRRRAGAEGARRPARAAGRDPDRAGQDLSPPRRLRQGAAAARTGARERQRGVRTGARRSGADASRPRRRAGGQGRLRGRGTTSGTGARHAAQASRQRARGRRRHVVGARTRLPGSRVEPARRSRCNAKR